MSFIGAFAPGRTFQAGYFLESEVGVVRKTRQITDADAVDVDGEKIVVSGTIWPANDGTAEGIVYEDVRVTTGDMPGSVVLAGRVYEDRLPVALNEEARTALEAAGFTFIATAPEVVRPY